MSCFPWEWQCTQWNTPYHTPASYFPLCLHIRHSARTYFHSELSKSWTSYAYTRTTYTTMDTPHDTTYNNIRQCTLVLQQTNAGLPDFPTPPSPRSTTLYTRLPFWKRAFGGWYTSWELLCPPGISLSGACSLAVDCEYRTNQQTKAANQQFPSSLGAISVPNDVVLWRAVVAIYDWYYI